MIVVRPSLQIQAGRFNLLDRMQSLGPCTEPVPYGVHWLNIVNLTMRRSQRSASCYTQPEILSFHAKIPCGRGCCTAQYVDCAPNTGKHTEALCIAHDISILLSSVFEGCTARREPIDRRCLCMNPHRNNIVLLSHLRRFRPTLHLLHRLH